MKDERERARNHTRAPTSRSTADERWPAPAQLQQIAPVCRICSAHHHDHHHHHHNCAQEQPSNKLMISRKSRRRKPRGRQWSAGLEREEADEEELRPLDNNHKRRGPSHRGTPLGERLFSKLLLLVCLAALFATGLQQQQRQELNSFTHRGPQQAPHQETNSSALHLTTPNTTTTTTTNFAIDTIARSSIKAPILSSSTSSDPSGQSAAQVGHRVGPEVQATQEQHNDAHSDHHSDERSTTEMLARPLPNPVPRQLIKRAPSPPSQLAGPGRSGGWKQQQLLQQQQQYLLSRITDADLLPLSDFTVEQPAFSDIMRMWPPTTSKELLLATGSSSGASAAASKGGSNLRQHQHQRHRPDHQANFGQRAPSSSGQRRPTGGSSPAASFFERITFQHVQTGDDPASWVRNHLNEDFDDTILTADESFEQDLLPEPATWVNYLGELGDFIYIQLRQFYDGSSTRSPFASSTTATTSQAPNRSAQMQALQFEAIEDLLDDFYYDQYENNQVLYYGPQLVREGDIFEIGCYLPNEQPAEWTKSGRSLVEAATTSGGQPAANSSSASLTVYALNPLNNPLRVIKRSSFMGAKQNFSLKVFEAQPSDTGSYRCNRLSRKYHKLIVVPAKISAQQLYLIQQKLLSIVAPGQVSSQISAQQIQQAALQASMRADSGASRAVSPPRATIQASGDSLDSTNRQGRRGGGGGGGGSSSTGSGGTASTNQLARSLPSATPMTGQLLPGYVLIEGQPMIVSCNISDEFILRRLRELPHFQLAWYKNGKLLRNSQLAPQSAPNSTSSPTPAGFQTSSGLMRQQQQQGARTSSDEAPNQQHHSTNRPPSSQRVQFLGANGRQMYIASANYADAADYLCSWSRLPARQGAGESDENDNEHDSSSTSAGGQQASQASGAQQINPNPLAAGNLHQLVAPVKLRPFKSAYHVRQHNQLRLVCQVQRGYPAAQISWYVGNQLVDGEFLRLNTEFKVLQLEPRSSGARQLQLKATPQFAEGEASGAGQSQQSNAKSSSSQENSSSSSNDDADDDEGPQIVEINPIPAARQQMQLTANGRGQWIEYRKLAGDRNAIDTQENQLRYLQAKMAQLTGANVLQAANSADQTPLASSSLLSQASLSVLVVSNLQSAKHTSRYACRATSRANTDEVTTVIRVKDMSTTVIKPHGGAATLIPGQSLNFECARAGSSHAEFKWYKRTLTASNAYENPYEETRSSQQRTLLEPNTDDSIEIHNERLVLVKAGYDAVGDYICQSLDSNKSEIEKEFGVIKVRAQPYIDDFGLATLSHTGKSATVTEGERLVMTCHIRDPTVPVTISWLRSELADDERHMVPLAELDVGQTSTARRETNARHELVLPTYQSAGEVIVERVDNFTKRLVIESVRAEHRGHYTCLVDNGVTERSRKTVFIRIKDDIVALWPFLGILAELFILFTIIYVWETQRAQKAILAPPTNINKASSSGAAGGKRAASGPASVHESVPLNR